MSQRARPLDLVLSGGIVVDGTGAPGRRADVGVLGDRIAAHGDLDARAASQVLDVSGLVGAPGFIDVRLADRATNADGRRAPEGMVHVVVNGRPVLRGGAATGARPGRLLRR